MYPRHIAIVTAAVALTCSGCDRAAPDTGAPSASVPTGAADLPPDIAHYFTSFQSVRIRVLDATTSEPIEGAEVRVVCMGGTPHADNRGRTDDEGYTSINYRTGSHAAVDVSADQFIPYTGLVRNDAAVVRLDPRPE